MQFIRSIFGFAYLIGVLIIAFDCLYYLFYGMVPSVLKPGIEFYVNYIDNLASILCLPVAIIVEFLLSHLPAFFRSFLPITNTDIMGAQIAWVPILSLFLYTGILKTIDDYYLKSSFNKVKKNHQRDEE